MNAIEFYTVIAGISDDMLCAILEAEDTSNEQAEIASIERDRRYAVSLCLPTEWHRGELARLGCL